MSDLITTVLWALLLGHALRPPPLGGRAGFLVYVLSMPINELPLLFLVLVTAGIVTTLISGAPEGWWGVAWSIAWALIVAGRLWLQIRARSARPALEAALASALGDGWRTTIRPELAAHLSTRTPWLAGILLPLQRRHPEVERVRNLAYGPDARAHRLDLYRNLASPAGRPILIHFHGGGFVQGRKSREAWRHHGRRVVSLHGYLGARTDDPASSPVALARREAPPMLLVQGRNDTCLPLGAPVGWAKALRSASGSPVAYADLPHAQHSFDLFASVRARTVAHAVEAFLARSWSHPTPAT